MSLGKQSLATHLEYSAWATRILFKACANLTPDELTRDLGASHRSITDTLRHTYYSERAWLERLQSNALPPMIELGDSRPFNDLPAEPDFTLLTERWPDVWNGWRAWLEPLTDDELNVELSSRMPDGADFLVSRWQILQHSTNHSTLHRGQIISMLRALGQQPPNTDVFSYYLTGDAPASG